MISDDQGPWYLAGPMSGYPDLNFPLFDAVAGILRRGGREIISPHEINAGAFLLRFNTHAERIENWRQCMRKDIAQLVTCRGILMLPGWRASEGATLEHHIATKLGMRVEFVAVRTWPSGPVSIATGSNDDFDTWEKIPRAIEGV